MSTPRDTNERLAGTQTELLETPGWFALVRQQVEALRFGQIQITVHDGRVVQVELTERIRLDTTRTPPGAL